mmetsp:Transcript_801/g.669  ORF Transcript_801/g.669 Transcript_801/m.669 type:complete len:262 (+) Transcript_801:395-1180(+)
MEIPVENKSKTVKKVENLQSLAHTPLSKESSKGSTHGMVISQSAKHQISIKNELYQGGSKEVLHNEIVKLQNKIQKLEKGNQNLKEENKRFQSIYTSNRPPSEQKPPRSHYKPNCEKLNQRESSRTNLQYWNNFNNTDKISDFGRSYSFENSNSKALKTPVTDNDFAKSYNNYMTIPTSIADKENLKQNTEVDKYRPKLHGKESVLMQKVNRILEKRQITNYPKGKSKAYKKSIDRGKYKNSTFKSLKHCKNEIISRMNKN